VRAARRCTPLRNKQLTAVQVLTARMQLPRTPFATPPPTWVPESSDDAVLENTVSLRSTPSVSASSTAPVSGTMRSADGTVSTPSKVPERVSNVEVAPYIAASRQTVGKSTRRVIVAGSPARTDLHAAVTRSPCHQSKGGRGAEIPQLTAAQSAPPSINSRASLPRCARTATYIAACRSASKLRPSSSVVGW
jgi:hypothetical protein